MTEHFVPLKCQSCGASLEVYDDVDELACGYCGTVMTVQRRGGTVWLKSVADALARVQLATDRTVAELSLARYEAEYRELKPRRDEMENTNATFIGGCVMAGFVGLWVAFAQWSYWSWLIAVLAAGCFALAWFARASPDQVEMDKRLRELRRLIAEKKSAVEERR